MKLPAAVLVVLVVSSSPCISQEIVFRDDFSEVLSDRWFVPERYNGYDGEIVDGWWQWTPESTLMKAFISGMPDDVSITSRVRLLEEPESEVFLPILGRGIADPNIGSYYGGVTSNGRIGVGIAYNGTLQQTASTLDPASQDIDMRLDIEGNEFRFWAWDAKREMPSQPVFTVTNSAIKSGDHVSIAYNTLGLHSAPVVAWDFVEIRTIPEPSSSILYLSSLSLAGLFRRSRLQPRV